MEPVKTSFLSTWREISKKKDKPKGPGKLHINKLLAYKMNAITIIQIADWSIH